jgi:hypothetical protein
MEPTTFGTREEEPPTLEATLRQMFCPACGGFLLRIGGIARCLRCRYSLCESCEGAADGEEC